jgi:hypothetical protein
MSLLEEAQRFKTWEAGVEWPKGWLRDYVDYPDWESLYASVRTCFHSRVWSDDELKALIFAVARDDEIQDLSREMAETPELFLQFAHAVVLSNEPNAKWQIADRLSLYSNQKIEVESLLTILSNDAHEYVRRRALLALAELNSSHTEALAKKAWESGHEYERMAVLSALKAISSSALDHYLTEASKDGRKSLLEHVEQIQAERSSR